MEPRLLTLAEIEDIVSDIGRVNSNVNKVSDDTRDSIIETLIRQLRAIKIVPLAIPDLKMNIVRAYEASKIAPGTTVGVLAGASIGAPTTQMALNTFHAAGSSKNVSAGVGKMKELMMVSPDPKITSCSIYFNDRRIGFDSVLTDVRPLYVQVKVGDVVLDFDTDTYEALMEGLREPIWYTLFRRLVRDDFDQNQFILRLKLNVKMMYSYKISMEKLASVIEEAGGVICVYSPLHIGIMDLYPIPAQVQEFSTEGVNELNASIVFLSTVVLPRLDDIIVQGIKDITGIFPVTLPVISAIRSEIPNGQGDGIWFLEYNQVRMLATGIVREDLVELAQICGMDIIPLDEKNSKLYLCVRVPDTEETPMSRMRRLISDDDILDRAYEDEFKAPRPISDLGLASKITYADTNGSNLKLILGREDVDSTRTISSNIHQIVDCLGIEASRNFLILEFIRVIANEGSYVNNRHLSILADFVTNQGRLIPMTFSGAVRQPSGALSKASFQQPMNTFKQAALYGRKETVDTVSTSVYVGRRALIGTGSIDILLDEEAIAEQERVASVRPEHLSEAIWNLDGVSFGGDYTTGSASELDMMFKTSSAPSDRSTSYRKSNAGASVIEAIPTEEVTLSTTPIVSNLLADTIVREAEATTCPAPQEVGRASRLRRMRIGEVRQL